MELLRRTPAMPKVSQIAAQAGCSVRSVFERFKDLDGLALATADYAIVQAQVEAVPRNLGADRTTRIHSHVETRESVCEKWLPLWRLLAWREHSELRARAAMVRSLILGRLKLMYEPELATLAEPERYRILMALAALISFESWDQLRHSYGLTSVVDCNSEAALSNFSRRWTDPYTTDVRFYRRVSNEVGRHDAGQHGRGQDVNPQRRQEVGPAHPAAVADRRPSQAAVRCAGLRGAHDRRDDRSPDRAACAGEGLGAIVDVVQPGELQPSVTPADITAQPHGYRTSWRALKV
jgi:AcrR family transcriptional regulator